MINNLYIFIEKVIHLAAYPVIFGALYGSRRTRVIVLRADEILLVKPWLNYGCWTLPGGGIKKYETIEAAAVREVREETGIQLDPSDLEHKASTQGRFRGIKMSLDVFVVEIKFKPKIILRNHEIAKVRWVRVKDLDSYSMEKSEKQLLDHLITS